MISAITSSHTQHTLSQHSPLAFEGFWCILCPQNAINMIKVKMKINYSESFLLYLF